MSDPMTAGLDPVALLKLAQAPKRGEVKDRQTASGFEAMLDMLKAPRIPKPGDDSGAAFAQIEPDDEAPAGDDNNFWAKLDAPALPKAPVPKPKEDKLSQTAREFEGMLMTQMFQTLRKTVEPSGLFGDNKNERGIYEYLFDQSIFQKAAENGQTWGLATRLEEAWKDHFKEGGAQNAKPR